MRRPGCKRVTEKMAAVQEWLESAPEGWNKDEDVTLSIPITFPAWMWLCIATTGAAHGDTVPEAIQQIVDDGFDYGPHADDMYPEQYRAGRRKERGLNGDNQRKELMTTG